MATDVPILDCPAAAEVPVVRVETPARIRELRYRDVALHCGQLVAFTACLTAVVL